MFYEEEKGWWYGKRFIVEFEKGDDYYLGSWTLDLHFFINVATRSSETKKENCFVYCSVRFLRERNSESRRRYTYRGRGILS